VLVMTATPIPRTLAMTVYGDLDVSILDELPPGRKAIKSYWVEEEKRERVYQFIRRKTKEGRQSYIVYPLIEESEKMDLKAAVKMHRELSKEIFSDLKVGLLHGKMKSLEKERVMEDFHNGRLQVLISTVVIEVGIDVPNATVMVIEHPERFGLSQLHQLRGRIGRGEHESYCILIGEAITEEAKQRLSIFVELSDGFRIAEKDLEIRGPGEFLGTRQHGLPELKLANLIRDQEILEQARGEAQRLLERDSMLEKPENCFLRGELERLYAGKFEWALA
jgi:ATP-dependent DNA helicase RecG